jgi:uncharacterized protein (DUF433 family)
VLQLLAHGEGIPLNGGDPRVGLPSRIIPGKLSGEPHVVDTRIPTKMLSTLRTRGLEVSAIIELYPRLTQENVEEAIALEVQLERNLRAVA